MNKLRLQHDLSSLCSEEKRKMERLRGVHLLVVTCRGTGKIVDITRDGLSFGCLYPHNFPEIFTIDILDAKGLHLKQITARKTWQRHDEEGPAAKEFEMEVGVEFVAMPPVQQTLLAHLLAGQPPVGEDSLLT